MAVKANRVTVTTTATELTGTDTETSFEGILGVASTILVKVPTGGTEVFVGGSDVTAATGFSVAAGEVLPLDLRKQDRLYAITASGSSAVHVLRGDV